MPYSVKALKRLAGMGDCGKKSAAGDATGRAERRLRLAGAGVSLLAQPPLPLQEFLPAQPLSPALQLPWPLQEFLPLQSCLAGAWLLDWSEEPAVESWA